VRSRRKVEGIIRRGRMAQPPAIEHRKTGLGLIGGVGWFHDVVRWERGEVWEK